MSHLLTLGTLQQVKNRQGGGGGDYDGDPFGFTSEKNINVGSTYSETKQANGSGMLLIIINQGEQNVYLNDELILSKGLWDDTVEGSFEIKSGDNLKAEFIGNWFTTGIFGLFRGTEDINEKLLESFSWFDHLD